MARLRETAARELLTWSEHGNRIMPTDGVDWRDKAWQNDGLCVGRWDAYDFDTRQPTREQAAALCAGCPVIQECREAARVNENETPARFRHGVLAGMTPVGRFLEDEQPICQLCPVPHLMLEDGVTFSLGDGRARCRSAVKVQREGWVAKRRAAAA